MKKKLLITGASGFLGWNVAAFPQTDWELFGTYLSNNNLPKNVNPLQLDLLDFAKTKQIIEKHKPDAILHLAANSSTHQCEENPQKTEKINVAVPHYLAKIADALAIHFVFTSSEQVFSGNEPIYAENAEPQPKNAYGIQKLAAEKAVLSYPNSCVVRIAVLFGNAGKGSRNFLHEWLNNWKSGASVTVFHDEIRSFLSGQSAAQGLFSLLNHRATGIFHLAGKDSLSRLDFAKMLRKKANLQHAEIVAKSQKAVNTLAFRPANLSLDCRKAEELGFRKLAIESELEKVI